MLRPIRDLCYILPLEDREKIGGLYVPDQAKQRVDQGIIKYRGPKVKERRVGEHVIFSGWDGSQIMTEDDGLLIVMPENFILGVHENDEPVYVFTREQVKAFLERTRGDCAYVFKEEKAAMTAVDYYSEKLQSYLHDHFYAELHF